MTYYIKGLVQKEYESQFAGVEEFVVIQTTGLGGTENNRMRGALLEKGIQLTMVKNSLMRRAMELLGHPAAKDLFLTGPCTVAYGGDSVVDVAKELNEWANKCQAIQFRGAYLDGTLLDGAGAKSLAQMPSRRELQGQVVQLALSPGAKIASALAGPGGVIAGCLKSLIEKKEKAA
jgi:large subunit ribosomal protein L10